MKDIVNIKITPVKNVLINPLRSFIENFDPNQYTPEQADKFRKKGYSETKSFDLTTSLNNSVDSNNISNLEGTMMGWTPEQRKLFLQNLIKTKEKAKSESPDVLNSMNELINDLSREVIENKNFAGSIAGKVTNRVLNENILEAEKNFSSLKSEVNKSNLNTVNALKNDYESRIKKWTEDYEKSIGYYKQYIKNQENSIKELQNQNVYLSDAMQRNTDKLNALAKKWDDAQKKINNFEKELLLSNNKKYDEVIKSLKDQLAAEKAKQTNIDEKIALLRAEKAQLDDIFAENIKKLKQAGLGSHCPKGFNMNDYIHKKKIPCWGCIL